MLRLNLKTYSLDTVHSDTQSLLKEWREARVESTDLAVQLELERIDASIRELWAEWDRSKQNYTKKSEKSKGQPRAQRSAGDNMDGSHIVITGKEKTEVEVICLGDVSYLSEIRQQLVERRKLLGLYAPEKRDVTVNDGDLTGLTPDQRAALLTLGENILSTNGKN